MKTACLFDLSAVFRAFAVRRLFMWRIGMEQYSIGALKKDTRDSFSIRVIPVTFYYG